MKSIVFTIIVLGLLTNNALACTHPKIGGSSDWYPFAYFDRQQNQVKGAAYKFAAQLAKHMKWQPIYPDRYTPWSRSVKQLKSGELDIIVGIYNTQQRRAFMAFSKPYIHITTNIYVKKGNTFKFEKIDDLVGKLGGKVLGGAAGGGIDDHPLILRFIEVHTREQLFNMLIRERIDYIPFTDMEAEPLIKSLGLRDKIDKLPTPLAKTPVTIAVSKKSDCLEYLPQINLFIDKHTNKP